MLPLTVSIGNTRRRAAMPTPLRSTYGEIIQLGESKCVITNGVPVGTPRRGSNRTPHRLKNEPGRREMK